MGKKTNLSSFPSSHVDIVFSLVLTLGFDLTTAQYNFISSSGWLAQPISSGAETGWRCYHLDDPLPALHTGTENESEAVWDSRRSASMMGLALTAFTH